MIGRLTDRLSALPRRDKLAIVMGFDVVAMGISLWLAFCIRLGTFYWPEDPRILLLALAVVAGGAAGLLFARVYRVIIRYLDVRAARQLALGAATAAAVWFMFAFISRLESLPRSVGFIYFGVLFMMMFFGRMAASHLFFSNPPRLITNGRGARNQEVTGVAIYGANPSGCAVLENLRPQPDYDVRFFVDESPAVAGRTLMGLHVCPPSALRRAVEQGRVQQVLLALPGAGRGERLAIMSNLSGLSVKVMTVPSYEEIMSGRYTVSDVRPVQVEDLLKRDVVPPKAELIERGIAGRSVLITGAGGSIGSELCRQILRRRPRRMVLLDHSEFALYSIEMELRTAADSLARMVKPEIVPVMGSLLDRSLIEDVLGAFSIDTVFHAAAYKHVPLLEDNVVAGVRNNVTGTKVLADACASARIPRMMMISTDKAVRPANVMGASKRVSELYIQALAAEPGISTRFGIVRFGNVLDSSGSVVQRFRNQIRTGGPITVTHPEITRFFMSIPEATQLVLQANSLASGGEVFVLDMGEPVRILDLARTMISLSGLTERTPDNPMGDIEIAYVGLRPGEKLTEELFVGSAIEDTPHPQIKMARERFLPLHELIPVIRQIDGAVDRRDAPAIRDVLKHLLEPERALARPMAAQASAAPSASPEFSASLARAAE